MKRSTEAAPLPLLLGVAGGSGSGKTTFALALAGALGQSVCAVLSQDHYYIDQSALFTGDGESVDFDHPDALDWALLVSHLEELREGRGVDVPIYDFASHKRLARTERFEPRQVVILDGTLILSQPGVRAALGHAVFVDTEESVRRERRLRRDVRERGRRPEGVLKQFALQVKPMHDRFVEPSKAFADEVISGDESVLAHVERWAPKLERLFQVGTAAKREERG